MIYLLLLLFIIIFLIIIYIYFIFYHVLNFLCQYKGLNGSLALSESFPPILSQKANIDHYKINEAYTSQQNCLTDEIMFSSQLDNRIVEVSKDQFIDRI